MGQAPRLTRYAEPINIHIYSEVLQKFRLAAQGKSDGKQPPDHLRERVETHFDPLPFYSQPLEAQQSDLHKYPLNAITQRPMAMYHSWDSQNAWLRQIHTYNFLNVNTRTAREAGIEDGGWMWVESMHGKVRCLCRHSEAVEPGTVWTWNAIGKASGAWGLDGDANEAKQGFLLNHLISEELPPSQTAITCPIRIPSPARPAGTMCACAFTRPTLTKQRSVHRNSNHAPVPGQIE